MTDAQQTTSKALHEVDDATLLRKYGAGTVYARVAQLKDGRWCGVIAHEGVGRTITVLHVDADNDRATLERRIHEARETRPWHTIQ